MQVLDELMYLRPEEGNLPLPWYHRAALGHENNTTVSVVLVKNKYQNNFDVIVSVIEPKVWERAYRLKRKKVEESLMISSKTSMKNGIFSFLKAYLRKVESIILLP